MNKGNDINGGSIEEDIEILNSLLTFKGKGLEYALEKKSIKAIENILQDYTRQKQINEEHQKINGELREKVKVLEEELKKQKKITILAETITDESIKETLIEFEKNYISKQTIKDKIEELIIQGNYKTFYNPNGRTHFLKEESDYKIEVLQELLEGEK